MAAIMKAFVLSGMCAARCTPVFGLDGVAVSYAGDAYGPCRLYLTFPDGTVTQRDLAGVTVEECALDAARYLGLA